MRRKLGCLRQNRCVHIADLIARAADNLRHARSKRQTVRARIGRVGVGEQFPNVAERRRAEQCVHNGMDKHVRVRMTEQTAAVGNRDPAENQRSTFNQPVYVITVPDAEGERRHAFSSR